MDEPVRLPIEDALDLHAFHPRDVKSVVDEYVTAAHEAGLREIRLVHGRGTGVQRFGEQGRPDLVPRRNAVVRTGPVGEQDVGRHRHLGRGHGGLGRRVADRRCHGNAAGRLRHRRRRASSKRGERASSQ